MRTFSKASWDDAQAQWKAGQFSAEWRDYRHQAAMRGMIYPPEGSRHDSWDDDRPSQRAILIRAIRETPSLMKEAVDRSSSWRDVIAYILARRDEWRDDLKARERQAVFDARAEDRSRYRGAMLSIGQILDRIRESR